MQAIVTENLSKTYLGGKEALKGLNISLQQGEVFGFLGPNGAGKTTAVKLLTGLLQPTGGQSRVFGLDPATEPHKVHALSGVATEHAQMYDHLTGQDNLIFYGEAFGMDKKESQQRAAELLDMMSLNEAKEQKLQTYSTGMRQRLSLARALMHRPCMLFLDEPTSGLDPESALQVNQMIRRLADTEAATVFLCTHQLRYAQEVCTRFELIEDGQLLMEGTLDALRARVLPGVRIKIISSLKPRGNDVIELRENTYEIMAQSEEEVPRMVRSLVEQGADVYQVVQQKPTLEDIYFALTRKEAEQ